MEKVLIWLVLLFFFFVLPSILQAMAKKRAQQAPGPGPQQPDEEQRRDAQPAHAAEATEIERYLESIGVKIKIERRGPPRQREPEPPEAEPIILQPVEEEPYRSPGDLSAEPAPPPPMVPEPVRARVRVRRTAPTPRTEPWPLPTEEEPERPTAPTPIAAASPVALPILVGRPGLSDLRRAVVLSEVIRRPDFEQLPSERDLF